MKITIEATKKMVNIPATGSNPAMQARLWIGRTERGITCDVFVPLIRVAASSDQSGFEAELKRAPELDDPIPLRMLL
jgi:hypothetical protein